MRVSRMGRSTSSKKRKVMTKTVDGGRGGWLVGFYFARVVSQPLMLRTRVVVAVAVVFKVLLSSSSFPLFFLCHKFILTLNHFPIIFTDRERDKEGGCVRRVKKKMFLSSKFLFPPPMSPYKKMSTGEKEVVTLILPPSSLLGKSP